MAPGETWEKDMITEMRTEYAELHSDVKELSKTMNDSIQQTIRMEGAINERMAREVGGLNTSMNERFIRLEHKIDESSNKADIANNRIDKHDVDLRDIKEGPNRQREKSITTIRTTIFTAITGAVITGVLAMVRWVFQNTFK